MNCPVMALNERKHGKKAVKWQWNVKLRSLHTPVTLENVGNAFQQSVSDYSSLWKKCSEINPRRSTSLLLSIVIPSKITQVCWSLAASCEIRTWLWSRWLWRGVNGLFESIEQLFNYILYISKDTRTPHVTNEQPSLVFWVSRWSLAQEGTRVIVDNGRINSRIAWEESPMKLVVV